MGFRNTLEKAIGTELFNKMDKTVGLYTKKEISTKQYNACFKRYFNEMKKENITDDVISLITGVYIKVRKHRK